MSDSSSIAEEFFQQAGPALEEITRTLQALARAALLNNSEPHLHSSDTRPGLNRVSRQLLTLSEQTRQISAAWQTQSDLVSADRQLWPQTKILQSQEEERMQIARTLEESVGQLLANAVFELASYRYLLDSTPPAACDGPAMAQQLEGLQLELEQGLSGFRHFITDLDPTTVLTSFGLGGGVRRYLEQLEQQHGLKVRLQVNTNFGRLPTMIEIAIFRVLQEALNNVKLHANASQVDVMFDEKDEMLIFSVVDNGEGVVSDRPYSQRKNLGLARMMDYAELLNGKIRLLSEPGHGTQLILSIPYPVL
jgi:signal transduction histidine kinase